MSSLLLDHIIILLPHTLLTNLPPALTDAFTITPGGTHADGLTWNKLVVLPSGVYLELIAFVPSKGDESDEDRRKREEHWWFKQHDTRGAAVIDWCLTSPSFQDLDALRSRTGLKGLWGPSRKGGRKREDGQDVEWSVTFPDTASNSVLTSSRSILPFFCHDITPRDLRVPSPQGKHPSGVVGVRYVLLVCNPEYRDQLIETYSALFGHHLSEFKTTPGLAASTTKVGWKIHGEPVELPADGDDDDQQGDAEGKGKWWEDNLAVYLQVAQKDADKGTVQANGGVAGIKEICLLTEDKAWAGKVLEVGVGREERAERGGVGGVISIKFDEVTVKDSVDYSL